MLKLCSPLLLVGLVCSLCLLRPAFSADLGTVRRTAAAPVGLARSPCLLLPRFGADLGTVRHKAAALQGL